MKSSLLACAALLSAPAFAATVPVFLDFEGIGDQAQILDFYDGGSDSLSNPGFAYGVQFGDSVIGLIDYDNGGHGNFANEPSGDTVMYFNGESGLMNVANGFVDALAFSYSSSVSGTVTIWDGLDGTGNLLATIILAAQFQDGPDEWTACSGDPNGSFCNWTAVEAGFEGTAHSVVFGGGERMTGYDNISISEVPLPGTLGLMGLGLTALGALKRRKLSAAG